ncbi:MAG TPA: efflux RND transporter permease subunit [Candidatus Baltobacteraceae bacterium]|jgi:HAE1 family hydrophobic/amphiphilic exporter-1|nr:efflux RND transporter permease subunit [Candidatus Baltobacteraceae bacterium]
MSIARFAVTRRVTVAMIATAIIVLGLFAFPRLPVDLLPSFTPPVVNVEITYANVAPQTMETLITRPMENAISRVSGVQQINSTSSEGDSQITAQFYYGTNIDTAAVDVQQQVQRAFSSLPNDPNLQQPQVRKFDPNQIPVIRMFVTSDNMSERDLGDLWTNTLSDEFSSVNGVAAVTVNESQQRAVMIQPDANKVAGYGMTLAQIVSRVQQENLNLPAGIVQVANNEYQVQTNELFQNAQQIGNIIVTTKNGAPVYLHDIATVSDSIQEQRSFQRVWTKGSPTSQPAVNVNITAQPNANVVQTATGVYTKIAQVQKRYPGMHIAVVFDQKGFITQAVSALEHTAMYGAILAVLIILLFLHSWRSTLIVAISLPISVLGTLFAAYMFGFSLNTMTLGGLALAVGLIVDDAIVVIENIYRHMARGQHVKEAAESAVSEIFTAVLASSITVITVFVPLMLIPGLQGLLFGPFALMVMTAVAISLLVAVTTVPMLSTLLLRDEKPHANGHHKRGYAAFAAKFDATYERFSAWYRRFLGWAVDHPGRIFAVAGVILCATLLALKLGAVTTELFPASNSRFVRFNLRMPNGTALNVTDQVTKEVERRMRQDPRIVNLAAQVGEGSSNASQISITLQPGTSSANASRFVQQWQGALNGFSARGRAQGQTRANNPQFAKFRRMFGQPIPGLVAFGRTIDIVQNIISRGQDALDLQIYGPDMSKLYDIAQQQVIPKLSQVQGLTRPDTSITPSQPLLNITFDRTRAAMLGLSTQAISQTIDTATSGSTASYLQINGTQYPIIVQLPPDQRRSYQTVADLALQVPVQGANGTASLNTSTTPAPGAGYALQTVPLSDVASISIGSGPSEITRQNKQREIDVTATLAGIPLGAAVKATTQIMNSIVLPAGYYWTFGQAVTQQSDTFGSLGMIVLLAVLLIYMLLASQFESFLHPLVIMMAVPLSIAGVVVALVVTQRSFGLTAFIGLLMLVGIVVKNAILVVEFTNQLRHRGLSARDAVLQAAPLRLRPILMTTLATIGGMLPIAAGIEAGSETQAPLGTVVIGGLLCSTLLSLVVIPTLYLWVANHIEPRFHATAKSGNGRAHVLEAPREPAPATTN